MQPLRFRRALAAVALASAASLSLLAPIAARADGDPPSAANAAQQQLAQAEAQAAAARDQATLDQQQLTADQTQLQVLQQRIAALQAQITEDQALAKQLRSQITADRAELASFIRADYENGTSGAFITYVFSASDIAQVMQRANQVEHIAGAEDRLIKKIKGEEAQTAKSLNDAENSRQIAGAAQSQIQTEDAIIANDEMQQQLTAATADQTIAGVATTLGVPADPSWIAQARANDTIFQPIPGPLFTVDSDLTQPSGEDAATINAFLAGTALAGLGSSYVNAEQHYHVSARYLVAHSILESGWGTSAIAHDKHNLFGYGADDANPYGDAVNFSSFDACIQFVAQTVSQNYLSPGGSYYHGSTLRGMNVDYASDPFWSFKIASIAGTIPSPGG